MFAYVATKGSRVSGYGQRSRTCEAWPSACHIKIQTNPTKMIFTLSAIFKYVFKEEVNTQKIYHKTLTRRIYKASVQLGWTPSFEQL